MPSCYSVSSPKLIKKSGNSEALLRCPAALNVQVAHLDVSVDADGWIVDALQAFKGHWALLLVVDEEDDDPSREIQQDSDCGSFCDAAIRPAGREQQQVQHFRVRAAYYLCDILYKRHMAIC